jgi:twitching motility protein PilT
MFETEEQEQLRYRLSDTLRWVISQRLAPRIGGGRLPVTEIMGNNLRTKETIVQGESEGKSFYEIIDASQTFGWRTFDQSVLDAFQRGIITEETALAYSSKRGVVTRGIDLIRKARGDAGPQVSELRMSSRADHSRAPARGVAPIEIPGTLKLK